MFLSLHSPPLCVRPRQSKPGRMILAGLISVTLSSHAQSAIPTSSAAAHGVNARHATVRATAATKSRLRAIPLAATMPAVVPAAGAAGTCARAAVAVLSSTLPGTGASMAVLPVRRLVPLSFGVITLEKSLAARPMAVGSFVRATTVAALERAHVLLRAQSSAWADLPTVSKFEKAASLFEAAFLLSAKCSRVTWRACQP